MTTDLAEELGVHAVHARRVRAQHEQLCEALDALVGGDGHFCSQLAQTAQRWQRTQNLDPEIQLAASKHHKQPQRQSFKFWCVLQFAATWALI